MSLDTAPDKNPSGKGSFPTNTNDAQTSSFTANGYKVTITRPSPGAQYITTFDPKTGATNWMVVMDSGANIRITESGDIALIGAKPNSAACGGKFIQKTPGDEIKKIDGKSHTEVGGDKGSGDDSDDSGEDGPAYSLKVYGNAYIESQGGHLSMRGENVSVNAVSVLALKSDKDILLQAGEQGGKITMNSGTTEINTGFFNQNITGGIYKTVPSGEETTTQLDPRSTVNVVSTGNVQHKVLGDYKLEIVSKANTKILGKVNPVGFDELKAQLEGLTMQVTTTGAYAIKVETPQGIDIKAGPLVNILAGGIVSAKAAGVVLIKGSVILLN